MLGVLRESTDELTLAPQPGLAIDALARQPPTLPACRSRSVEGRPRRSRPELGSLPYRIVQEAHK